MSNLEVDQNIDYPLGEGFEVDQEGVWYITPSKNDIQRTFVCAPLYVLAYARDEHHENYCKLLKFFDPDGKEHIWLMPQELLASDGSELRKTLLSRGLKLGEDKRARELLTKYLLSCEPLKRVRTIDKTGWHGQSYVLPKETLGKQIGEEIYFSGQLTQSIFSKKGTLEEWQQKIGARCVGNSRLTFSVSAAFAGPLPGICHEENGGFHLRGASSTGKTTALDAAASLFGGKEYIQMWRATANGLEAIAKGYNDLLLPLDEMSEIHPKEAGEVAYMLSNGVGKARADKTGGAREKAKWRCLFLSTGEVSLAQHMIEDGKQSKAGQETRIADIPADLGPYGVFECLHGFADGASFSTAIKDAAREYHGTAGRAYIQKLSEDFETVKNAVDATIDAFMEKNVSKESSGQVKRVARRFALVAAAGELATTFNITGWPIGTATKAVEKCFKDWLEHRGDDQNLEDKKIISNFQLFFELHGESRFSSWEGDSNFKIHNRAGFKKIEDGKTHYYVLEEVFKNEICKGVDWRRAARLAVEREFLMPSSDGRSSRTEHLPGLGKHRCYRFINIPTSKEDEGRLSS